MPVNTAFKDIKVKNRSTGDFVELKDINDLHSKVKNAGHKNPAINELMGDLHKRDSSAPVNAFLDQSGLTLEQVWKAMGIENVGMQKVKALYENDYTKPFFNAQVEQGFRTGYEKGGRAQELIATTVNMDQMSYQYYYDDTWGKIADESTESELGFNEIAQGAPIPVAEIKVAHDRTIYVAKRGKGIEITDEAKSMNMDLLAIHARKQGLVLSRQDQKRAVYRLRNGYFKDGFDAPITRAAKDPSKFIPSVWHAVKAMEEETGMSVNRMVMNNNRFFEYMTTLDGQGNLLFLKELMGGSDESNMRIQSTLPFIDDTLGDNEVMLVDTSLALADYSFKPLSTETDRMVNRQIDGSYTTVTNDFIPWDPTARRVITFA